MKRMTLITLLVTLGSTALAAEKTSCRLVIHTLYESGKKLVEVDETKASSREECRAEAKLRELSSQDDTSVVKVTIVFAFRGPSVIEDAE